MTKGFDGKPNPRQIALPLPHVQKLGRAIFVEGLANSAALNLIERWPNWPAARMAIFGPHGAGKSHLMSVWADHARSIVVVGSELTASAVLDLAAPLHVGIDDAHLAAAHSDGARALFHLLNRVAQEGGALLLTGLLPPKQWATPLPDLKSRLAAITAIEIGAPDDALLAAVLVKLFADRQLNAAPDLIAYLVTRMERSVSVAVDLVDQLDREALETGRMLSIDLASRLLRAKKEP